MNLVRAGEIAREAPRTPVHYYLFDVLARDGDDVAALSARASGGALLEELAGGAIAPIVVPPVFDDVDAALATSAQFGLEGDRREGPGSAYRRGMRSESWLKVKLTRTQEVVIGGIRPGQGGRAQHVRVAAARHPRPGRPAVRGARRLGLQRRDPRARSMRKLAPLRTDENPFVGVPAARRPRRAVGAPGARRRGGVRRVHARRHPAPLALAGPAARQVARRGARETEPVVRRARSLVDTAPPNVPRQACASCSTWPAGSSWNVECSTSKWSREARLQPLQDAAGPPVGERRVVDDDVRGEHRRAAGELPHVHVVHVDDARGREDVVADLA